MTKNAKSRAVVAVTGASGLIYAVRLLRILALSDCEISCIVSDAAMAMIPSELGAPDIQSALASALTGEKPVAQIKFYSESDFFAPPASGSFRFDAMAVIPCSMKTLGKMANSIADNLIIRAADVALKERRRLVVVPRETPLALTHLRNMCALSEAGAVILPACPAFYNSPKTVEDLADFVAARTASSMGFEQNILKEWGHE